jgi:hypothetical protein
MKENREKKQAVNLFFRVNLLPFARLGDKEKGPGGRESVIRRPARLGLLTSPITSRAL